VKALLVGDNRSGSNWGGRGVSLALRELFRGRFDSSDSVLGSEFSLLGAGFGYIGTTWPRRLDWVLHHAVTHRQRRRLFDLIVRAQETLGARDFVARDPAQTAANILRYRKSNPGIARLYERVAASDLVLINGEGDVVFETPPRREVLLMLGLMELALRLDKRVALINSMLSDCPRTGRNQETVASMVSLLRRCDAVVVRDEQSLAFMEEVAPGVSAQLVPDALFEFGARIDGYVAALPASLDLLLPFPSDQLVSGLDLRGPYCCVGGSASAGREPERAIVAFTRLVASLRGLGMPLVLVQSDGRDGFLKEVAANTGSAFIPVGVSIHAAAAILAHARVFVSGRYHPSILASLGGAPCVFLGSTAHKMSSVQGILGYDDVREFSSFVDEAECQEVAQLARRYIDAGATMRTHLRAVASTRTTAVRALPDTILSRIGRTLRRTA
jgi:polysaccharide pyruvyl transferase WcaK-like protein